MRLTRLGGVSAALLALVMGPAAAEPPSIVVQSTTSTQASGLFDDLLPRFTRARGIEVKVVAVGTGQALANARAGNGDVVLVHAPQFEQEFVASGDGIERLPLMRNEFVIVGPAGDPAQASTAANAAEALQRIADAHALFASRGDESGTHVRELELWQAAGFIPDAARDPWYRDTGSGMLPTLMVALELDGYTLIDQATWDTATERGTHRIVCAGDPALVNHYSLILVNPVKHPQVQAAAARTFVAWMRGAEGQAAIANFKPHGHQLFFPSALP